MTPTLTDEQVRALMATWPHDDMLSRAAPDLAAECLRRGERIAELEARAISDRATINKRQDQFERAMAGWSACQDKMIDLLEKAITQRGAGNE